MMKVNNIKLVDEEIVVSMTDIDLIYIHENIFHAYENYQYYSDSTKINTKYKNISLYKYGEYKTDYYTRVGIHIIHSLALDDNNVSINDSVYKLLHKTPVGAYYYNDDVKKSNYDINGQVMENTILIFDRLKSIGGSLCYKNKVNYISGFENFTDKNTIEVSALELDRIIQQEIYENGVTTKDETYDYSYSPISNEVNIYNGDGDVIDMRMYRFNYDTIGTFILDDEEDFVYRMIGTFGDKILYIGCFGEFGSISKKINKSNIKIDYTEINLKLID